MSQLYLKDIKIIIITSEFKDAVLAKSFKQVRDALIKHTGDSKSIKTVEIDEYLGMDSTIENIDKLSEIVAGSTIAVTVLNNPLYMQKFHNSVLHNVMKYIYKISIVSSSWVDDMLVKNGIGKAEMRFNSMLTYALPFKSCVINETYLPNTTCAQREMLTILLNVFDISVSADVSNPMIDNEVILVDNKNKGVVYSLSETKIDTFELDSLIETISIFIKEREVNPVFKGKQIIVSKEIETFQPIYKLVKQFINLLNGKIIKQIELNKNDPSIMSLEHNIDADLSLLKIENRCSLFYLFDRWGINCEEINALDSKYKFSYHYPYLNNFPSEDNISRERKIAGLTNFFGYHKFMACYFLKKLGFEPSKFLSKKYYMLVAYVKMGNKYNFAKNKSMLIVSANDVEYWYAIGEIPTNKENFIIEKTFLTYKLDEAIYCKNIEQNKSKIPNKYLSDKEKISSLNIQSKEISQPNIVTVVESPTKEDLKISKNIPKKIISETFVDKDSEISFINSKQNSKIESDIITESHTPDISNTIESARKRVLTVEASDSKKQKLPSKKQKIESRISQDPKKLKSQTTSSSAVSSTTVTKLPVSDSISKTINERIALSGGNNEQGTFQNTDSKLNVMITGIDLKIDSTNTNFVYMSSIKNVTDLYNTNLYILDKMGINFLENKDFGNCDCIIVGKKTATFYESLAYSNIKYYVTFDFISNILEKVYKRKKNIDLSLEKYRFKDVSENISENIIRLAGKKLFESVGIKKMNLINAKNSTTVPDPKESVFKEHGIKKINLVNYDTNFGVEKDCIEDIKNYKVLVINNTIKNTNPIVAKLKKQIKENNNKTEVNYLVVTWDFIMRCLLNMEIKLDNNDKGILIQTGNRF